jgi:hypothetical protein
VSVAILGVLVPVDVAAIAAEDPAVQMLRDSAATTATVAKKQEAPLLLLLLLEERAAQQGLSMATKASTSMMAQSLAKVVAATSSHFALATMATAAAVSWRRLH